MCSINYILDVILGREKSSVVEITVAHLILSGNMAGNLSFLNCKLEVTRPPLAICAV